MNKMKKVLGVLLVSGLLILPNGIMLANESHIQTTHGIETVNGERYEVSEHKVESREIPDGTMSITAGKAGKRYSSTKTYKSLLGNYYFISKSQADYQQNVIGVRGRAFDRHDGLVSSKSDKQTHSTIASVKVFPDMNSFYNAYAVGNHTYERKGFKNYYPETKSYWGK
jgi:hypothetical protein